MKKLFKIILWSLISLIIIVLLAFAALVFFVDPNHYKGQISDAFQKSTGRALHINGKLSWTLYPNLGVEITNTEIDNPAGFTQKTFAKVNKIKLLVALTPLLENHINIQQVVINGLALNLIKISPTQNNWTFPPPQGKSRQNINYRHERRIKTTSGTNQPALKAKTTKLNIQVKSVVIQDAQVNYTDNTTHSNYRVKLVNAKVSNFSLGTPFTLTASFILKSNKLLHPIALNINFPITISPKLNGITIKPLAMKLDQSNFVGNLSVAKAMTSPHIKLLLKGDRIDLAQYMNLKGALLPISNLGVNADITGKMSQEPLTNTLNGTALLTTGNASLKGISVSGLLKQLKQALSGIHKNKLGQGDALTNLKQSLSMIRTKNGRINPNNGQDTSLPSIHIPVVIKQGVAHTDNLMLQGKDYYIRGNGTLDLARQHKISYVLTLGGYHYQMQQGNKVMVKGPTPVPLIIGGTLQKPTYVINWNKLTNEAVKEAVQHYKENLMQKIKEKGKGLFKNLFKK